MSKYNLASRGLDEREKIDVDLAASGIACRERLNLAVNLREVEARQPGHLLAYFYERLAFYREKSQTLPKSSSINYQNMR